MAVTIDCERRGERGFFFPSLTLGRSLVYNEHLLQISRDSVCARISPSLPAASPTHHGRSTKLAAAQNPKPRSSFTPTGYLFVDLSDFDDLKNDSLRTGFLALSSISSYLRGSHTMLTLSGLIPSKTRTATPLEFRLISHCIHRPSFSFSAFGTRNRSSGHRRLCIRALDAAQPYDYEAQIVERFEQSVKLRIAIVGFGNFGQFLAETLVQQGHTVLAYSRSNYSDVATKLGVSFYSDPHDLCEEHPEVILLCTSILSAESVLKSLPLQRLKRSTLFVDVLSVKEMPRNLFLKVLPSEFDILCTHPMFGPESGKNGWAGLPLVYEKVRIGNEESRVSRCNHFLNIFAQEGCRMVEMSCAEHDRHAAGTQFITHFIGRTLGKIDLDFTPINTKGYETLLNLRDNTCGDSFELFYGLFIYNKNALEQLERLDMAFESVKRLLFGHSHDILRKQMFENAEELEAPQSSNGAVDESPKSNNGAVDESRRRQ